MNSLNKVDVLPTAPQSGDTNFRETTDIFLLALPSFAIQLNESIVAFNENIINNVDFQSLVARHNIIIDNVDNIVKAGENADKSAVISDNINSIIEANGNIEIYSIVADNVDNNTKIANNIDNIIKINSNENIHIELIENENTYKIVADNTDINVVIADNIDNIIATNNNKLNIDKVADNTNNNTSIADNINKLMSIYDMRDEVSVVSKFSKVALESLANDTDKLDIIYQNIDELKNLARTIGLFTEDEVSFRDIMLSIEDNDISNTDTIKIVADNLQALINGDFNADITLGTGADFRNAIM
jgi:hypothetical protein